MEKDLFIRRLQPNATKLECANGEILTSGEIVSVHLSRMNEDRNPLTTRVDDVLYPPQTHSNLISLGQSSEKGIDFKAVGSPSFGKNRCYWSSNWSGVSSQQFEVVFQNLILSSKEIFLWMEHYITAGLATRWRKRLERMDGIHKEKFMWTALFFPLGFDEIAHESGHGKGQIEKELSYTTPLRLFSHTQNHWKATPILLNFTYAARRTLHRLSSIRWA